MLFFTTCLGVSSSFPPCILVTELKIFSPMRLASSRIGTGSREGAYKAVLRIGTRHPYTRRLQVHTLQLGACTWFACTQHRYVAKRNITFID